MSSDLVTLEDKYVVSNGRVYLTGVQALVRLPLQQAAKDKSVGLNTAGYISGYRGSPLGTYDDELARAQKYLVEKNILFVPGVNEDLAATAVWGSQQAELTGEGKYDGVFSIWYGKGPGVDRSGDVFRHANLAGSSSHGGVLVLMGDDHTCESSTTCHQSEYALVDASMPVLSPSGVQELLDFGLYGWAMSRYSGCWVGLKCVKDVADATASIDVSADRVRDVLPEDYQLPEGGLNIRTPDTPHDQEERLYRYKLDAARAFVRANKLDVTVLDPSVRKIGIVTHGKSYLDILQAFRILGLEHDDLLDMGVGLYKVACTWPLEPLGLKEFAEGYGQIIVVEEKRGLVEAQIKDILFGAIPAPVIIGKKDEQGQRLFQEEMALNPLQIALALGERCAELSKTRDAFNSVLERLHAQYAAELAPEPMRRSFYFCAGCPHSSSTVVPDGSKAYAGIGCSWMAQTMDRNTQGYTHMGGEGMSWVGEAPFSKRDHMFQNIGDGTYFHSGFLAIRAAVAAKTNITFKILYNDAVAMTGGQQHDGTLNPAVITRQVHAEGVNRIVVVTDDPKKYPASVNWAPGVEIRHRDDIIQVQEILREIPGTTVLVYDQTCAAEKRRRRKRNLMPTPTQRLMINDMVCEGCGDCGEKSNCVALVPVETELGRKRAIDQSACNIDWSCNKGFCPSFVTVYDAKVKRGRGGAKIGKVDIQQIPDPDLPCLENGPYALLLTGVGGTGIVTVSALLGMAAHLEGKGCGLLDMAGLAQKGGSVWSHMQFGKDPDAINAYRIAPGGADAVLGCDLVVSASQTTLTLVRNGHTRFLVNDNQTMTGEFTRKPDLHFPAQALKKSIEAVAGADNCELISATEWATSVFGDTITTNMLLVGYAYQRGLIPLGDSAIEQAIEINGVAVATNIEAFRWGRQIAHKPDSLRVVIPIAKGRQTIKAGNLQDIVDYRTAFLTDYQNRKYADNYVALVEQVKAWEERKFPGKQELSKAVAKYYFKLLAYKDEYEVARLYTLPEFKEKVSSQFEDGYRLAFNLAPPLLLRPKAKTGEIRKIEVGSWIMPVFSVLAKMRFLRGTKLDVFGFTEERKAERALIKKYERTVVDVMEKVKSHNYELAIELLSIPEKIRGFGHVKHKSYQEQVVRWHAMQNALDDNRIIEIKRSA